MNPTFAPYTTETLKTAATRLAGIGLLFTMAAQPAFAQQGDDCLQCHTSLPATEFNLIPEEMTDQTQTTQGCDYTFAEDFDGWGWNPDTGQSCAPLENNNTNTPTSSTCDYTNASSFQGWGWDPVANSSCPPLVSDDPHSQFPICSAAFYDAEGDGFGWENEASCIVTSDSAQPPVFTNQQTGNQVNLVRAYWDGNTDIADKVIQCDLYYYDSYYNQYRREDFAFRAGAGINNQVFPSYRFQHLALPPEAPYLGWIANVSYVDGGNVISTPLATTPNWTTNDGRYIGPTVLQEPYLELSTRSTGAKAVRAWVTSRQDTALNLLNSGNRVRRDGYFECYDINGRDFQPTGIVRGGTTSPRVLSDLVFSTEDRSFQQTPSEVQNRETGYQVNLKKAYWNYNRDLAGKEVQCTANSHVDDGYGSSSYRPVMNFTYNFPYHFTNSENRIHYSESNNNNPFYGSFPIDNNVLRDAQQGIFHSSYVEEISQGVRFWSNSNTYTQCQGIKPTGLTPTVTTNNQCDYSNADLFDGWGWNPATGTSCAPQTQSSNNNPTIETVADNNCDYSNAGAGGWGWNPVTRTSCQPRTQATVADSCDYTNAGPGGWGWDPVARRSCSPR